MVIIAVATVLVCSSLETIVFLKGYVRSTEISVPTFCRSSLQAGLARHRNGFFTQTIKPDSGDGIEFMNIILPHPPQPTSRLLRLKTDSRFHLY
jgi:hypothetical protein